MNRRKFVRLAGGATCGAATLQPREDAMSRMAEDTADGRSKAQDQLTLFLAGDVMLGRSVDQILPHPSDPRLHEPYVGLATTYVELAERAHGRIPAPVDFSYVWGDALDVLERVRPDARIINLETSITTSQAFAPKGIHYKMHPKNVSCLSAAGVDCCVLANNHVLDWGVAGLRETLDVLENAGIPYAGAGRDAARAEAPATMAIGGKGRVLVFAFGSTSSGIPRHWAAGDDEPGVKLLPDLSDRTVMRIAERVRAVKRPRDVAVASIHWGGNWGYEVPHEQTRFAHRLVDLAGFDVVHGHSSHHPKGIEIYRDRPILYGCGDFLNDYEGIEGYEEFRDDLVLMYLPTFAASSGELMSLRLVPLQVRSFRLYRASREDAAWLRDVLARESGRFGTRVELDGDDRLTLSWR